MGGPTDNEYARETLNEVIPGILLKKVVLHSGSPMFGNQEDGYFVPVSIRIDGYARVGGKEV